MTYRIRPSIFFVALIVFVVDRITKYLIISSVISGRSIKIIPNIFHITLVLNKGAAFGLFKDLSAFFAVFSLMVIAAVLLAIFNSSNLNMPQTVSLALILGGAAGNLLDRLKYGHVIDFLDFRIWPVFNIADSAITIGIALIAFDFIIKRSG